MWLALTGAVFLALMVAAAVEQVRYERRTGPKCPCGCGRSPEKHVTPLLRRVPRQVRGPR